jgi:hypothetical protein
MNRLLYYMRPVAGLIVLLALAFGAAQDTFDSAGMTLAQFRNAVEARLAEVTRPASRQKEGPPADLRPADEAFRELLTAQARQAAAQQSLDRLAGWSKAIQARLQLQSVPELDGEMIRFAEARLAAESARYDHQRQQAAARANALLGRPAEAPLSALLPTSSNGESESGKSSDLLAQGRDLLSRMYQSYSFGGTQLGALLWQEQQVYQAELDYRVAVARDAVPYSAPKE